MVEGVFPFTIVAFRPKTFFQRLFCIISGQQYIHIGILVRYKGENSWRDLRIYHASKEAKKGVIEPLGNFIDWEIHFYRLKDSYESKLDPLMVVKTMEENLGADYGWNHLNHLVTCSGLVSLVMNNGGLDPCPYKGDASTFPDDIVFSHLFERIKISD